RVDERLAAGVAAAVLAVERGASIVRTHDVAATVDALKIAAAVMARTAGGGRD
ncbi:MAG: dihydropteroate synthase, partial [Gammaproteobacteria bacterium]|nr:dihydropteroate synthase [Gammaproteobacteria bacterium]